LGIAFALICHCWHSAQAEGQSGAQQACEKTFCFFHFSTSSLKKIIIGWAAGPPGLRVLHQHGVQCGALQRGNAAAPPALCREEKRRKNWAACPLGLRLRPAVNGRALAGRPCILGVAGFPGDG